VFDFFFFSSIFILKLISISVENEHWFTGDHRPKQVIITLENSAN
jgi:hypothetical protein